MFQRELNWTMQSGTRFEVRTVWNLCRTNFKFKNDSRLSCFPKHKNKKQQRGYSCQFCRKEGKCHNDIPNTTKIVHNNGRSAVLFTLSDTHPLYPVGKIWVVFTWKIFVCSIRESYSYCGFNYIVNYQNIHKATCYCGYVVS